MWSCEFIIYPLNVFDHPVVPDSVDVLLHPTHPRYLICLRKYEEMDYLLVVDVDFQMDINSIGGIVLRV